MKHLFLPLLLPLLFVQTSAKEPKATGDVKARLRFLPEGGSWKGETPFKGASWHNLGPGLTKGVLWMQARAGVGDKFPVGEKDNATLFEVAVAEGNDERLVVEVRAKEGVQRVELPRDTSAPVEVAGAKYELRFPTVSVAAAPGEKPSTNKATIQVSRRL